MRELVVIGFDNPEKAEEVRQRLYQMQKEYILEMEDAVVAVKGMDGNVKLNQPVNLKAAGAAGGTFWGALIGCLFLNPLLGAALGAASGAISGALADVGIKDDFMRDLGATLQPGSAALFVLVRKATPDKVLAELKGAGGKLLKTSLTDDREQKLQAALDAAHTTA